ncbi:hypothetical protein XH93_37240 [Bradyrhizobium sp. CCBAU 51753]|nr:hypothetical protein XH93_37240 [Bradyrhizobium sp. CCBAU 51753]
MPEALIIPNIMLRRGQNGINVMSSSCGGMRQRTKRTAGCRSRLQLAVIRASAIANGAVDFPRFGKHFETHERTFNWGATLREVTACARELAVKRINKAITDYMKVFAHFGLFEEAEKKHVYRLTDLGVSYYERLEAQSIRLGDDASTGEFDLPSTERIGVVPAGGSHSPVTLHDR